MSPPPQGVIRFDPNRHLWFEHAEVLVSRTVVDLVVGSAITFVDRGDHELKGVPGTWRLFKLEDPDLGRA